jgi:hypothetical protein
VDDYLELSFDVFDQTGQRAKVRRTLTVDDMVKEILREFDDLDISSPEKYALYMKGGQAPLPRASTLVQLDIRTGDELDFRYLSHSGRDLLPENAQAYLLEDGTRQTYEICWQPALIGRSDTDPAHNELLAVNLDGYQYGKRVSRRHAQITWKKGQFYLESLAANNPTYLNSSDRPLTDKQPLHTGDRIRLGSSQITLIFFVKNTTGTGEA